MLVSRLVRAVTGWGSFGLLVGGLMFGFAGCDAPKPAAPTTGAGAAHSHDHADLATGNFAESVASLRKCHDEIKTAFDAGKPDDAHHVLHDVGHVLEALEKQVDTLAAEKQESAKAAVKAIIDGYGKIDGAMHDNQEVNYAEMGGDLATHVATLEAAK